MLNWLDESPRRFKTYVGNRVSTIIDLVHPDRWRHVRSADNPADCASRGLYPSKLINHQLWWNGPSWLRLPPECWPKQTEALQEESVEESDEISLNATVSEPSPVIDPTKYSSFNRLKRGTAWVPEEIISRIKPDHRRTEESRNLLDPVHPFLNGNQSSSKPGLSSKIEFSISVATIP